MIPEAFRAQYELNCELLYSQASRFREGVTEYAYTPGSARWPPEDYEWADLMDGKMKMQDLIDPGSPYAMNSSFAHGRALDDEIISVLGRNPEVIPAEGQGMTVAKLRNAMRLLLAAGFDIEKDTVLVAITAEQHADLLRETTAISLDFTNHPVLNKGRIRFFMGFNFIHTERIGWFFRPRRNRFMRFVRRILRRPDDPGERRCPVWVRSAVGIELQPLRAQIEERDDKENTLVVYTRMTIGVGRLPGTPDPIEIRCEER